MGAIASQITSLTIVYSTVFADADQRRHQSSASLAFVWEIHRGPVNSPPKWPVTRKIFPFDDVIMIRDESEGFPWDHIFSIWKFWHFLKHVRSWVEKECCCLSSVDISYVNFTNNILGSRFGFCVVSERIQASRCVADRPLAVLTGLAEPDPVTRSGKNKQIWGSIFKSDTL